MEVLIPCLMHLECCFKDLLWGSSSSIPSICHLFNRFVCYPHDSMFTL